MNALAFFVGGILPYLAVAIFLAGFIWRIRMWARTPQPGKMTVYPSEQSTARGVLSEALFFPSLFKGDKLLWVFSWTFHVALALAFLGHFRVVTGLIDAALMAIGVTAAGVGTMSAVAGGAAGVVLLVTAVLLLVRRMTVERARQVSGFPDFFALGLLVAVIVTGNVMRFGPHIDLELTRAWTWSLLTFSPVVPIHGPFILHAALGFALMIYMPFSKILHAGGLFFTQALIKRS